MSDDSRTDKSQKRNSEFANEAARLANLGLRVHPLRPKSKKPFLNAWQKVATDDLETIADWWLRWPDANIGVVMGQSSGVIDLEADSPEAEELLLELFEGYDLVTPTYESSRGKHRLFAWTSDLPNSDKAHWKIGNLDFKVGGGDKGTYCLAPPSIHPDGPEYKWLIRPEECEPAEIPPEVVARIATRLIEGDQYRNPANDKPVSKWREKINGVGAGDRNQSAAEVIGRRLRDVQNIEDAQEIALAWEFARAWNTLNTPPLKDSELKTTFESILKRERSRRVESQRDDFVSLLNDPRWKLVQRLSEPVEWKLYSPLWKDYASLTTEQLGTFKKLRLAIMETKGVCLKPFHQKHWDGWFDKKTNQTHDGKIDQLMAALTREEVAAEEHPVTRLAGRLWDGFFCSVRSAEKPELSGFPCRLPDGSIWFRYEVLKSQLSHGERDFKAKDFNTVLRRIQAKDQSPRVEGRQLRFKVLDRNGIAALQSLALHGIAKDESAVTPPSPEDVPDFARE